MPSVIGIRSFLLASCISGCVMYSNLQRAWVVLVLIQCKLIADALQTRGWTAHSHGLKLLQKRSRASIRSRHVALRLNVPGFDPESAVYAYLSEVKQNIVIPSNTSATLRKLISYGDTWLFSTNKIDSDDTNNCALTHSGYERVTGCTSTVHIRTSFKEDEQPLQLQIRHQQQEKAQQRLVKVEGSADSRVTQGMLAILCNVSDLANVRRFQNVTYI